MQKASYEAEGKFISYVAMAKNLTWWRHSIDAPWLNEVSVHLWQQALKDLEKAYQHFFAKRAGTKPSAASHEPQNPIQP